MVKGHATENDFIVLDDRDGDFELTPALVRALCDRHAGIGADGVLRVVRSDRDPAGAAMAAAAPFFMDYRNADGSVAEMCGNGVRLFLRYLQSAGLAGDRTAVATRGGVRQVWSDADGLITVEMGQADQLSVEPRVRAHGEVGSRRGIAVQVPNPHVVVECRVERRAGATRPDGAADRRSAPARRPERRVRACDSGRAISPCASTSAGSARPAHAAPASARPSSQRRARRDATRRPGRSTSLGAAAWFAGMPNGELLLTGPAELVGEVELSDAWLARADDAKVRPDRNSVAEPPAACHHGQTMTSHATSSADDGFDDRVIDLDADFDVPRFDLDRRDAGEMERAERSALRRVAGLSTELEDITEVEYRQLRLERVVLVGVWTEGTQTDAENSLTELARLAETAGSQVLDALIQRRDRPDPATYIGSGKAKELRDLASSLGADTVICDGELTPGQLRQLEERRQGQGRRPNRADPRHLRPARPVERGQGSGRTGPASVPAATPARLGRVVVASGRRPGRRWARYRWPRARVRPSSRSTGGESVRGRRSCGANWPI